MAQRCRGAARHKPGTRKSRRCSGFRAAFDTEGRAYHDRKIAEGKSSKDAIRALKRKISDRIYYHYHLHLIIDARGAATA